MPIPNTDVVPDDSLIDNLAGDIEPKDDKKTEDNKPDEDKVPYHQDPNVQLYIERQVAKRVGEGNQAWEDRIAKLEDRITSTQKQPEQAVKIGDWEPANTADAKAAKAIIQQAKQEMLEDLRVQDQQAQEAKASEDKAFTDWLTELQTTSVLTKEETGEFAEMIVKYKLNDKEAALGLWDRLKQAKTEGATEGEIRGIKKAQEAKVGSGRKGNEPGQTKRSFSQRRAEEPNFSAILDRELNRLKQ